MSSKSNKIILLLFGLFIFAIIAFSNSFKNKSPKTTTPQKSNIDTSIIKSSDSKYSYMNTTNNFQTYFPQDIFDPNSNIKFQKGESSITFNLLSFPKSQKNSASEATKNQIFYPKIYQNGDKFIDLKYTIYSDKLTEEIILNKFQQLPQISQHLNLFNTYVSQKGQQLNFYHPSTNELIWFIPAPIMYEQNDRTKTNSGLIYQITCDDPKTEFKNCRKLTLTKTITPEGQQWLSDPTRNYPVVIDPNLQINNADTATQWVSTNTAVVTVSQDTTNKVEGTGSVKVVVGANLACWASNGSCDAGCANTTITPVNVFTTCTANSNCPDTNVWTVGGVGDSACTSSAVSTGTAYNTCTATACGCWGISGSCDGGCADSSISSASRYQDCTANGCNCWGISSACNSGCTTLSYSGFGYFLSGCSGSVATRYQGSGSCSTSGNCYRLTSGGYYHLHPLQWWQLHCQPRRHPLFWLGYLQRQRYW